MAGLGADQAHLWSVLRSCLCRWCLFWPWGCNNCWSLTCAYSGELKVWAGASQQGSRNRSSLSQNLQTPEPAPPIRHSLFTQNLWKELLAAAKLFSFKRMTPDALEERISAFLTQRPRTTAPHVVLMPTINCFVATS